ncbi:MAG: transposase [Alistipes sp.]
MRSRVQVSPPLQIERLHGLQPFFYSSFDLPAQDLFWWLIWSLFFQSFTDYDKQYTNNLADKQWQVIKNILEPQLRKRKHSLRSIINAIFYLNKTGCQWRMLPNNFPPHDTVFYYFNKWKQDGSIE